MKKKTRKTASLAAPLSAINRVFNHLGLRKFFQKLRNPLILLACLTAFQLVPKSPWFWVGITVSFCGAAFQWWCFACIMTSKELAQNGPYRFVRNPMYLARYVMVLGLFLMLDPTLPWRWLWPAGFSLFYAFFMHNRVLREERKLREIFGAPYLNYLKAVPRFVPSLLPSYPGRTMYWNRVAFSRNNGIRNMLLVLTGYLVACVLTYGQECVKMYRDAGTGRNAGSLTHNIEKQ